jgi:hypothetical protein
MTSQFLARLFQTAELPRPVLNTALGHYGPRYPMAFSQNRFLGPAVASLTGRLLEHEDDISVIALIRTRNAHVLAALLAYPGTLSDTVLYAIDNIWALSARDAQKLATCATSKEALEYLLHVAAHATSKFGIPAKTKAREQTLPLKLNPPPFVNKDSVNETVLVSVLVFYRDFTLLTPILIESLGDGSSESSISAWSNFFGLVESDPEVPLQTVLDTARILTSVKQ